MTKKDKLTIVPEQAKGRWYHLFVERDDTVYGKKAKVIFQHSDDVFKELVDEGGFVVDPGPGRIGVTGTSEYVSTSSNITTTEPSVSFVRQDSVAESSIQTVEPYQWDWTDGYYIVPTYKLVDGNYVKQDTFIILGKNQHTNKDLVMSYVVSVSSGNGSDYPMLQFDSRHFSISNVVATETETEDNLLGGILKSVYEGNYLKVYITPNVTSLNLWIYGAFTE